jgi:CBS domain-containing membrane protein
MPHPTDIDLALADLGETFDVSREDLDLLFRRVEFHTSLRRATRDKE